jgi:hypothetical protein
MLAPLLISVASSGPPPDELERRETSAVVGARRRVNT